MSAPSRFPPEDRQVQEAEDGADEALEDAPDEERTLEEVLQAEVENLAEEIAAVDAAHLEALESGIEASSEALVTMREARSRLAEVRKDCGYRGPGVSSGPSPGPSAKTKSIAPWPNRMVCFDCGLSGHCEWQKPGQGDHHLVGNLHGGGLVTIRPLASAMRTCLGGLAGPLAREAVRPRLQDAMAASYARSTSEALSAASLAADKALVGALDSACNRTCAGDWIRDYLDKLSAAPEYVQEMVQQAPVVGERLICLWVSAVPVESLGLLIGRDALDALQAVPDFASQALQCKLFGDQRIPLVRLSAAHLALPLMPEKWPLQGKVRWRCLGLGNVLDIAIDCRAWTKRLLQTCRSVEKSGLTSQLVAVAESSVDVGRMPYNYVLLTLAQSMDPLGKESGVDCVLCPRPPRLEDGGPCSRSDTDAMRQSGLSGDGRPRRQVSKGSPALAKIGPADGFADPVEHPRYHAVRRKASRTSLASLALSFDLIGLQLALADGGHGAQQSRSSCLDAT